MGRGKKIFKPIVKAAQQVVGAVKAVPAAFSGKKLGQNAGQNAQALQQMKETKATVARQPSLLGGSSQTLIQTTAQGIEEKARTRRTILGAGS